jgi:hypothetical protein
MNEPCYTEPGPIQSEPVNIEYSAPAPPEPAPSEELALRSQAPLNRIPAENKEDPAKLPAIERHSRKCQVCSHPNREAIEKAFVHWRRPTLISQLNNLSGDSLYRHARAFNLFARRRSNVRSLLENIMERGIETEITGDTMLRAVRSYVSLSDDNRWTEPNPTKEDH